MAIFQIHPHFGYLNSDVRMINSSDSSITVKDSYDGKEFEIPSLSSISARFSAGEHTLSVVGTDDESETIVIEDAVKFGGSKEKRSYIFEGTPWVIMVMLDRTYFYNRETNEQYIEHGLAPKDIKYLNHNYVLFISEKDNSVFSLDNLSVETTVGGAEFLFSNEQYSVFTSQEGLVLYSFDDSDEDRRILLNCNDFAIDDVNQVLYYHLEDRRVFYCKQLDNPEKEDVQVRILEDFRCFAGKRSIVYGNSPLSLHIMDLRTKDSSTLYDDAFPVTSINGKDVWNNNADSAIVDTKVNDSFTSSVKLTVYERTNRWLCDARTKHSLKNKGIQSDNVKYALYSTNEESINLLSDEPMKITEGKTYDCVNKSGEDGYLIFNDKIVEFKGKPLVSPDGYILIATKDENDNKILKDPLNDSFLHPSSGYETENLFHKTGLIKVNKALRMGALTFDVHFKDVEHERSFANSTYEDLGKDGFYRLSGVTGDYIHSIDGYVHSMPCTKSRLIAVSEQCNYAIVRSEEGIVIYAYDSAKKEWSASPLGNMNIDESFYSKAVFCADGENIIYQKKGNEYYMRCIGSDEETEFDLQGSVIRRNLNGYVPYLDFDTHRKPVYVDPVSLTRIEEAAAKQFTYRSIDGTITHIAHNCVKYFSNEKKKYVSADEYLSYKRKYDYEAPIPILEPIRKGPQYELARKNRTDYFNANKNWLLEKLKPQMGFYLVSIEDAALKTFLDQASVCEKFIFKNEYYIQEDVRGEVVEIRQPERLKFLNYVSYSYDNRYIIISGKFEEASLAMIYDTVESSVVYQNTKTMAVWLGVFSKKGMAAFYDSTPISFFSDDIRNAESYKELKNRSFLTFSPSGKYMALSRQGYIPYASGNPHWGHQPSHDVYVVSSGNPEHELAHYCDHGDQIEGTGGWDRSNSSVASATFSMDDKKLMTVSKDGVVVIRNLHFEETNDFSIED